MNGDPNSHGAYHLRLDKAGRIRIPASLRRRYGINVGDPVILQAGKRGIEIKTVAQALSEAQALFKQANTAGASIVDALIAERREEAAREEPSP